MLQDLPKSAEVKGVARGSWVLRELSNRVEGLRELLGLQSWRPREGRGVDDENPTTDHRWREPQVLLGLSNNLTVNGASSERASTLATPRRYRSVWNKQEKAWQEDRNVDRDMRGF